MPGVADEDLSSKTALPLEGARLKELETFIESAREKTHVPGAAVAVVQDGKIVFEKGFGVRERGKKEPVTHRTRFMIGSVTKSLSTLLISSLVDDGKVKWDARVKELLPTFETGDAAFTDKVTLAHTFCACTGMPRRDLDLIFEYGAHKPEDSFKAFIGLKPTTGLGETFQYSNQMTALGGFLAARIAEPRKPLAAAYASAMKARVFVPMGMTDTTASFEEGRKGAVASPHGGSLVGPHDEATVLPPAIERFVEPLAPAGAVFSTAHDMARYALVELAKGKTPEGKQAFGEANLLERRKARVRVGAKGAYGLGLATSTLRGVSVVTHDGGTFGFVARLRTLPRQERRPRRADEHDQRRRTVRRRGHAAARGARLLGEGAGCARPRQGDRAGPRAMDEAAREGRGAGPGRCRRAPDRHVEERAARGVRLHVDEGWAAGRCR